MPSGIAASDRKLLLAGGILLVFLLTATVVLSPPREETESAVPSTYSPQSAGAEGAYRLLIKLHYPIRRWESPPGELGADPENTLLILADPIQTPTPQEKQDLADFVEEGGHVLFTGANIHQYFPGAETSEHSSPELWESFSPTLPTRITRGARTISLHPSAVWKDLNPDQLGLYGDSRNRVVVSWSFGDGSILWWASATPLTNAGITHEDNLTLFLNSVSNWDPKQPYKIYWDEYFHGQRASPLDYVRKTPLGWSGWQLALLALAIIFTFSRRSGPTYVPAGVSRLSPLEFVDTLGGLYERAKAASSAISISALRLRSLLARQLAMPLNSPNSELERAAETRLGWKDSGLAELLTRADNASHSPKVPPKEALDLVQKLEAFTGKLDVRSHIHREKT